MKYLYHLILAFKMRGLFVALDPIDNSVTLSQRLAKHIKRKAQKGSKCEVFVFYIPSLGLFGFSQDFNIDQETQICIIQYNEKHKCIGFETLCPSVGRILYDYGLPADKAIKLSVRPQIVKKQSFYSIQRPYGKINSH